MLLIVQLTAVFVVPETVAVKKTVSKIWTEALPGARETLMPVLVTTLVLMPAELTVPGSGFLTVTETLPTCPLVAVPVAVNCEEETRVVTRAVEPKLMTALGAKWVPLTVSLKLPTGMEVGLIDAISGVGFWRVTALLAVFVESVLSVAMRVMPFGLGGNSGAVKRPLVLTVPVVLFPPTTPFTVQATAGAVESPVI